MNKSGNQKNTAKHLSSWTLNCHVLKKPAPKSVLDSTTWKMLHCFKHPLTMPVLQRQVYQHFVMMNSTISA